MFHYSIIVPLFSICLAFADIFSTTFSFLFFSRFFFLPFLKYLFSFYVYLFLLLLYFPNAYFCNIAFSFFFFSSLFFLLVTWFFFFFFFRLYQRCLSAMKYLNKQTIIRFLLVITVAVSNKLYSQQFITCQITFPIVRQLPRRQWLFFLFFFSFFLCMIFTLFRRFFFFIVIIIFSFTLFPFFLF